jgi:tRNA threonylcarbamoyladenosine biosynthesis protein TsaB
MTAPAPSSLLLAFDTSTPTARVALFTAAGQCLGLREKTAARHSANLLALCDEVLREAGVKPADLEAIACGAGPGSFTGLRVGLAVAKGLALPSARPLVLVSSLDALANDLLGHAAAASADVSSLPLLLPCIDAGKGQVYARLYRESAGGALAMGDADWVLTPADLCMLATENARGQKVVAGGTGVDRFIDVFRQSNGELAVISAMAGPSASAIATLARRRLQKGEHDDLETAVPRYGRAPDITRPKNPLLTP